MEHIIDATNKKVGRIATEAASILMGKNNPSFRRNIIPDNKVKIINASKADIARKKLNEKEYSFYSGHPGGLRLPKMKEVASKKGYSEVFRLAIHRMLPPNKLRVRMEKNLEIVE